MPAPQTTQPARHESKPTFAHINLMVDTFLANAEPDDLRAIIRTTLAGCPPSTAGAFTAAARKRLAHTTPLLSPPPALFAGAAHGGLALPAGELDGVLRRARALYGAGLGFAGLGLLAAVVRATLGLRWDGDGPTADALAAVDADLAQALQSAREELGAGRVGDLDAARDTVRALDAALAASLADTARWEGEFPFERALGDLQCWKL